MQVTLRDQTNGRLRPGAMVVDWQESLLLTARTLIAERVRLEWEAARAEPAADDNPLPPLVTTETMRRLNPFRAPTLPPAKARTLAGATAVALAGFQRNAFFLIVDGRQVTDLDEPIAFRTTSQVTFLRLVPLVGG